jgi:addiction module HigA family antidote
MTQYYNYNNPIQRKGVFMAKKELVPAEELSRLLEEYQIPVSKIAADLGVSQSMIRQVLSGKSRMGIELTLKLDKYFGGPAKYWAFMQLVYDCSEVTKDKAVKASIKAVPKAKKPKKSKAAAAAKNDKKVPAKRGRKPKAKVEAVKEKKPRGRKPKAKAEVPAVKAKAPRKGRTKKAAPAEPAWEPEKVLKTILVKKRKPEPAQEADSETSSGAAATQSELGFIQEQEWPTNTEE